MTREKLFHKAYARELLAIAEGDLDSAEVLAQSQKGRKENICYAIQQSIEKALKAVICAQGSPVPLTHTIEVLLDRIEGSAPPHGDELIELTDYATIKRYQEGSEIITPADIAASLKAGREVQVWAKERIEALLGGLNHGKMLPK